MTYNSCLEKTKSFIDLVHKNDKKSVDTCIAILDSLDEKTILTKSIYPSDSSWLDFAYRVGNIALVKYISEKYSDSQDFKDYALKQADFYYIDNIFKLFCHYFLCVNDRSKTYQQIIHALNIHCIDADEELISHLNSFGIFPNGVEVYVGKTVKTWYEITFRKLNNDSVLAFLNTKYDVQYYDAKDDLCFIHDLGGKYDNVSNIKIELLDNDLSSQTYSSDVFSSFEEFREYVISKYT